MVKNRKRTKLGEPEDVDDVDVMVEHPDPEPEIIVSTVQYKSSA